VASRVTELRSAAALGLMALSLLSLPPATLAAGGPGATRCRPPGSRTLVVGPTARVYSMHTPPGTYPESRPPVFGCLLATGHSRALNKTPRHEVSVFGQGVGFAFEPATIALGEGPWVAYADSFFSIDTSVQTISSRNLRTGATVRCAIGFTQAPARPASVTTILIGRDGTIVWSGRSGAHATEPLAPEVGTCDARENGEGNIVDHGPEIDLGSLVARGRSAVWIDGEKTHTVPLR
jgi:hypothetical protein